MNLDFPKRLRMSLYLHMGFSPQPSLIIGLNFYALAWPLDGSQVAIIL